MHPGHPLMLAMSDMLLEQHANLLRQGAILVDPADEGTEPWLLFLLTHEVKSGDGHVLSKRLQFVRVEPDGSASFAGWAPHLDLEPLAESERPLLKDVLDAPWIRADQEQRAVALAAATLVPEHYSEVADRRIAHVDKTLAAVHERLTKEIDFWSGPLDEAQGGSGSGQGRAAQPRECPPHGHRPRRPPGEPQEGTSSDAPRRQRHARGAGRRACRSGRPDAHSCAATSRDPSPPPSPPIPPPAAASSGSRWTRCAAPRKRGAAASSMSPRTSAAGISPPIPPAVGRQAAGAAPHRSQGPRERGSDRHRHAQRNALRLQPGRQVRAGHRARRRGRYGRRPVLHPQPLRPRAGLGRVLDQLRPGQSHGGIRVPVDEGSP